MGASKLPRRLTDRGARAMRRAGRTAGGGATKVPGPSPNPATNLLITDIAVRGAMMVLRRAMEKGLLQMRFDPDKARDIVQGRTMGQTLLSAVAARLATRSVPGFALVASGILAKSIIDRSTGHRARLKGEAELEKQAQNAPEDTAEPI